MVLRYRNHISRSEDSSEHAKCPKDYSGKWR